MSVGEYPTTEPASAPQAARRGLMAIALWVVLAEVSALIIWLGAVQPLGMPIGMIDNDLISYGQRLWPLAALTLCAVACAVLVRDSEFALRLAAVPSFLARHATAFGGLFIGLGLTAAMI